MVWGEKTRTTTLLFSTCREGGFSRSLFALLAPVVERGLETQAVDDADGTDGGGGVVGCRVQLRAQYRMNERILRLANTLFYDDRMECASDAVAKATIPTWSPLKSRCCTDATSKVVLQSPVSAHSPGERRGGVFAN